MLSYDVSRRLTRPLQAPVEGDDLITHESVIANP